jgi:hypothetical protein
MDPRKERFRRIRGVILKLLACEHPGSLDLKVLHFSLDNLGYTITEEEMRSHLDYLEKKTPGLVKVDKRKTGRVEIEIATVTPDGLDVLDEFRSDPGIDTNF